MNIKKGDVLELTFNDTKKVFMYCGKIKVSGGNDRLLYNLKSHKEIGFNFKNYIRVEQRYMDIHKIRIIKNLGLNKSEEYKNKFQEYFNKL